MTDDPVLVVCWALRTGTLYVEALRRLGDDRRFVITTPPFRRLHGIGPGQDVIVLAHGAPLGGQHPSVPEVLAVLEMYRCHIVTDDLDLVVALATT